MAKFFTLPYKRGWKAEVEQKHKKTVLQAPFYSVLLTVQSVIWPVFIAVNHGLCSKAFFCHFIDVKLFR